MNSSASNGQKIATPLMTLPGRGGCNNLGLIMYEVNNYSNSGGN